MTRNGNPRVVVITGASGGVGRAVARRFAQQGCRIGLLARGRDGLEAARREVESLGGEAMVIPADVSDPSQIENAATTVEEHFGPIDIWVNNAMVSMYAPFMEMSPEEFRHITAVTYFGYVYGTQSALKRMLPRDRGVIIQIGSALAHRSIPLQSAYCGAKHAINGFTESVRTELLHQGSKVRLSIVSLPGVNTTQFEWTKNKMPNKPRPTGPIFQPEVAAQAVAFVADHDRKEIYVGGPTVESVVGEKIAPRLMDRYLAHAAWEGAFRDEPDDPNRPDDFWQPVPGDHGAHGPFDRIAKARSIQLWITMHRRLLMAALGAIAFAACGLAMSRRRET
ncbi:MAG TPA: SDR family oxidoreductase [Tepidisphaeraceae bacterium]|jgi:NAD(P)-dependent dehydrogenase (short-subunit alcohol dehydrogenase family)|nr:SDR family oxidoreductase [Tepidisphaeraceae bacterium]